MEDGRFVARTDQLPQDELADHLDRRFDSGVEYSLFSFVAQMRVVSSAGTKTIPRKGDNTTRGGGMLRCGSCRSVRVRG